MTLNPTGSMWIIDMFNKMNLPQRTLEIPLSVSGGNEVEFVYVLTC